MNMMTKAKRGNDRGRGRESEQKRVHRKETAPHPLCVCSLHVYDIFYTNIH